MTTPILLTEVDVLRRRVMEMEAKDEELIRMADQCRELDHRLAKENRLCHGLKVEVVKLNGRISELDRVEEALGKSKQDCSVLKSSLEQESEARKILTAEVDTLRVKVMELEAVEGRMEKTEMVVRQDLCKLRTLTVALVEERKGMAEKLKQAEEKMKRRESQRNEERSLAATERLREESQTASRLGTDFEEKIKSIVKEKAELQNRLKSEEEKNRELEGKITTMKKKLDAFDNNRKKEKYAHISIPNNHTEDNKIRELTQELDMLRKRLQDKEVLKRELIKAEKDFEFLEKKLQEEQRRTQSLTGELELAKKELSRYEHEEKQEVNQEHLLLCHLQKEQVKSRLLTKELDSLKEKLQKLTGTEESICRVQMDHTRLQRKLTQQEIKNKKLAVEMEELKSELEEYRHIQNLHLNKGVQTELEENMVPDLKRSNDENDQHVSHNVSTPNRSSLVYSFHSDNSSIYSRSNSETDKPQTLNGEVMMLTHMPGQPLHIKVMPHHARNTATFEISGPSGETAASYTTTAAVIPSPKRRISITPAANPDSPSSPDSTASQLVTSNLSSGSIAPDSSSQMKIVTVRTCSPEPSEALSPSSFCSTAEQLSKWQSQESDGINASPSVITAEDSKIHIHLGSQYLPTLNGMDGRSPHAAGPYCLQHQQSTQVISNGCLVKSVGKITSSITISPALAPASHSSNITVKGLYSCE
ncbi:filamin A-interacting protein 1-like [Oryzias melastigma]|uniref:Filamin A-interacting protein 1-like n=1 Tax=Oryzias melastigma TaxID=30732 RepID=A0A3B3C2E2_ORYME|nr:filamin A-interacting protein 1-like [Oryzias melastigma]XP_024142036.1 filamin A-interacting protein 1-like [Oryzias melastigma]